MDTRLQTMIVTIVLSMLPLNATGKKLLTDGFCESLDVEVAPREFVAGKQKLRVLAETRPTDCAKQKTPKTIHIQYKMEYVTIEGGKRRYKIASQRIQVKWGQHASYIWIPANAPVEHVEVIELHCLGLKSGGLVMKKCKR